MRDLFKYPITMKDVMVALNESYMHQAGKGYIGDTSGYSLALIKEFLENNKEFEVFLKSKELKNA